MKKNNCLMLTITLFVLGLANVACQGGNVSERATTNHSQPESPKTATEAKPVASAAAGSLATPTEAYKTAYAARQNKDVEGLKRVLSKDILGFFEAIAEADKKTLDDELKELTEQPQASTDDTRNEKITGDTATLDYKNEKGEWESMDFIKEGRDWKLTLAKPKPGEVEGATKKPN